MGMFDYVDTEGPVKCPKCDADVEGFQTKSTECTMSTVHWSETSNFYSLCACGHWVEFTRKRERTRFKGFTLKENLREYEEV